MAENREMLGSRLGFLLISAGKRTDRHVDSGRSNIKAFQKLLGTAACGFLIQPKRTLCKRLFCETIEHEVVLNGVLQHQTHALPVIRYASHAGLSNLTGRLSDKAAPIKQELTRL